MSIFDRLLFRAGELIFCGRAEIRSTTDVSDGHFLGTGFAAAVLLASRSWPEKVI